MNAAADDSAAPPARRVAAGRLLLAAFMGCYAAAWTALFVLVWFDQETTRFGPGLGFIAWLLLAPLSLSAAAAALRASSGSTCLETGLMAVALGVCCVFSAWTLPDHCFSLRLFLVVAAQVFWVMAALIAASQWMRRLVLSGFVLFHFAGILSATMTQTPSPWIFNQIWVRFFRPYLEFVYINNAYRFFSPNPGPANYFWFRVFFDTGAKDEKGEAILDAIWRRMPETDLRGASAEPASLLYQRLLAHTQNAEITVQAGPSNEAVQARLFNAPPPWKWMPEKHLGDPRPAPPLVMEAPLHPAVAPALQYRRPNLISMHLIRSFCRHVAATAKHPTKPELAVHSIKVYRVEHSLASYQQFAEPQMRRHPNDPETYYPFYYGQFAADGSLIDDNDPFLYWLLPILREQPGSFKENVPIYNWCHKHAGDPQWSKRKWDGPWE
jgi:hypothetical protein